MIAYKKTITLNKALNFIFIAAVSIILLIYLTPVYIMVVNALKNEHDIAVSQLALPSTLFFGNIIQAIKEMQYLRRLLNNLIVCCGVLILLIPVSSMAAYSLSKRLTRLNRKIYSYFLMGVVIPVGATLVPLYTLLKTLHLFNYGGLILVYVASAIPWAVFMYSGFMAELPLALEESAIIDGCNNFKMFWKIMFPLVKNGSITVATINLLGSWNDFLYPMLFLPMDRQRTLMVSVYQYRTQYSYDFGPMFAAMCLATLPFLLLFFFGQRYIIKGVVAGAIKG